MNSSPNPTAGAPTAEATRDQAADAPLVIRGLVRDYVTQAQTLHVLTGVDLHVNAGEMVALVGPSGSGKSSLLHAAGLLERPTAGAVLINGQSALDLPDDERTGLRRRHIGFVYQQHHLLPEFSALENVALPQLIAGQAEAAAVDRARDLLTQVGLVDRLAHRPSTLSGGEQQRVAFARALANRPSVVLADEPTGNLDAQRTREVFATMRDLVRAQRVAALVATHNIGLAEQMDRVVSVRNGALVDGIAS